MYSTFSILEMLISIIKVFEFLFLEEAYIYILMNLFILIRILEFSQISRESKLIRKLSLKQFTSSSLSGGEKYILSLLILKLFFYNH